MITAVSKEICDYYSKDGFNVIHVPNAVDLDNFPKKAIKRFENQIIYAGRLSKEKGIDTLLDTAKRLPPEYNLLILGTGPEEEKVRNVANSKTNVHYLGYQSKQNTISLIRGSDLLIQPSVMEGISSTLLEAMGCGTCIIASNVGGNPDMMKDGVTGFLVEKGNQNSLLHVLGNFFLAKLIQIKYFSLLHAGVVNLTDVGCNFRFFRAESLKKIVDELTYPDTDKVKAGIGVAIHLTMLGIQKDLRIIEIPITFNKRRGKSKIGSNRRIRAIKIGLTFLWLILKT